MHTFSITNSAVRLSVALTLALLAGPPCLVAAAPTAAFHLGPISPYRNEPGFYLTNIFLDSTQSVETVVVKLKATGLRYVDTEQPESIFPITVSPPIGSDGSVSFTRSRPGIGFSGKGGEVSTVVWQAIVSGTASVAVTQDSSTSDSTGKYMSTSVSSTTGTVTAPTNLNRTSPLGHISAMMNTGTDEDGRPLGHSTLTNHNFLTPVQLILLGLGIASLFYGANNMLRSRRTREISTYIRN